MLILLEVHMYVCTLACKNQLKIITKIYSVTLEVLHAEGE